MGEWPSSLWKIQFASLCTFISTFLYFENFFFILFLTTYSQWAAWFSYYKKKKTFNLVQAYTLFRIYLYISFGIYLYDQEFTREALPPVPFSPWLSSVLTSKVWDFPSAKPQLMILMLGSRQCPPSARLRVPRGWQVSLLWRPIQKLSSIFVQKATTF